VNAEGTVQESPVTPRPGKTSPKRLNSRGHCAAPADRSPRFLGYKKVKASGSLRRAPWPGGCQPALAAPARQNRGGPRQDWNLPRDGQRPTAKSAAKSADRWVGSDKDERWPVGTGTASAAGRVRLGRWPILARAPGEDGPNSEKDNPQEPRPGDSGRTRLLPADWAHGGHQCPEELPWPSRVSLERVSSYDPKAA
jgi:hypothetical protein